MGIVNVEPVNTANFTATRLRSVQDLTDVHVMADQFGWKIGASGRHSRHGKFVTGVVIFGRNKKRYVVAESEWIIALGANGSLRVCTEKQFMSDYRITA